MLHFAIGVKRNFFFGRAGKFGYIDFFGGGCRHFLFHVRYTALQLTVGINLHRLVSGAGSAQNPGKSIGGDCAFCQRAVGVQSNGIAIVTDNPDRFRIGAIKGQGALLERTVCI